MVLLFAALATLAGSLIPLQAGINATLRQQLGNPLAAAIVNFLVGLSLLFVFAGATRMGLPGLAQVAKTPWWCWLGGLMGASLVLAGVFLSHRLGAAAFVACFILGQLTSSVVVDHFGLAGYTAHAANLQKLGGVGLLALGAWLIRTS